MCESALGYKGYISLNSLNSGQSIAWFHQSNPFTIQNIKKFIDNNDSIKCSLISEVWSSKKPLEFKCTICGNIFTSMWNTFSKQRSGIKGCPKCSLKIMSINKRVPIQEVIACFYKYGYTALFKNDDYTSNTKKLLVSDSNGYLGRVSYKQIVKGSGFSPFHSKNEFTHNNINHYIEKHKINCKFVSGEYLSNKSLLTFECKCGNTFTTSWNVFTHLNKTTCNKCSHKQSKMEEYVEDWLLKKNIPFKQQYSFANCKNKLQLRFDFYIDTDPEIVVECQGIQHYQPVDFFGGDEAFEYRTSNDKIKKDFCIEHNIKIIELPYYEFKKGNLDKILEREILL